VEIRSKDKPLADLREKCEYYLAHGVETAWLIDPQRKRAEVLSGRAPVTVMPSGMLTSPAMPGLEVPLAELFAELE
jgi:Uma2 family endonuclease